MPVFRLTDEIQFPPPHLAQSGLLAVGGDLSRERLLRAYAMGIFPWYAEGEPILWWSPGWRMVLRPEAAHVPARLRRTLRQGKFRFTADTAFAEVMRACAQAERKHESGTWINEDMQAAYTDLHHAGYAHSVEVWLDGALAGGLYGVSLGACFFGESMFSRASNTSKAAFATLCRQLGRWNFELVDCQMYTAHLERLGASEISRAQFLALLERALRVKTRRGPWQLDEDLW